MSGYLLYVVAHPDAVTIVLFQVLGAFANRPFDAIVNGVSSNIGVSDVSLE